jgi:hypothetical protein
MAASSATCTNKNMYDEDIKFNFVDVDPFSPQKQQPKTIHSADRDVKRCRSRRRPAIAFSVTILSYLQCLDKIGTDYVEIWKRCTPETSNYSLN